MYPSLAPVVRSPARKFSTVPRYVAWYLTMSPGIPVRNTFVNVLTQPYAVFVPVSSSVSL